MRDDERALQAIAEAAEESGNLAEAYDDWQALTVINPKRPDYPCKMGSLALKLGRWPDAEQAFLSALSIDNGLWLAMALLASLFLQRKDGDRSANAQTAKSWLEKAIALTPHQTSLTFLAVAHLRLGDREAAKSAFRRVIELDDSYEEAYYNLGLLLSQEGQNKAAEQLLRKAVQLDPDYHFAHGQLGIVLKKLRKYDEAEVELNRAIEIKPTDTIARGQLKRLKSLIKSTPPAKIQ